MLAQLGAEAEPGEVERRVNPVEQTKHDAFAMQSRDDRHAQIDLAAFDDDPEAAVLGQPALGDIDAGHYLEPADDVVVQPGRRRGDVA